jgi:lysozyme|tara:strand:+ start:4260 stop:4700 length:441 start_codon:yes stop_codon:yes gene_type:complete
MDLELLRKQIEADEGCKYEIYLDHLGLPTFGIGHLVTESDEEYNRPVGTFITTDRVAECFNKDVGTVLEDCERLYPDFDSLPEEVQLIIANMMFNMGYPRLSKFKGMKAGVDARDWQQAADEMVDSKWYHQVTNRAKRLVSRMREV